MPNWGVTLVIANLSCMENMKKAASERDRLNFRAINLPSDFKNYGHNEGPTVGILLQEAFEIAADFVLHDSIITAFFVTGVLKGTRDDVASVA